MYKIYADDALIYDSALDDYKIGKGQITKEPDKSGSIVFSLYPDHPYYDRFVRLKTAVTVYKDGRIVFRGRVLNDVTDHWNNKVLTCEGELGFLRDTIVRPGYVNGSYDPRAMFVKLIEEHNAAVEEFKQFRIGTINVSEDPITTTLDVKDYVDTLTTITNHLLARGHLLITHGEDDTDPRPTIHYLADYTKTSSQAIEFGVNLRNYTKTVSAEDLATAIIPLGAEVEYNGTAPPGVTGPPDPTGTGLHVNTTVPKNPLHIGSWTEDGKDYVYNPEAVALYGWIFKVVTFDGVTDPYELIRLAEERLASIAAQYTTIELTALDLHLLDRSIESYNVCEYIPVSSPPHGLSATLLCNKQTLDLLKPENDTVTLGHTFATFTQTTRKTAASVSRVVALEGTLGTTVSNVTADLVYLDGRLQQMESFQADLGMVSITLDGSGYYTADRSFAGIKEAVAAGIYLVAHLEGAFFCQMVYLDDTSAQFHGHSWTASGERHVYVTLNSDESITVEEKTSERLNANGETF